MKARSIFLMSTGLLLLSSCMGPTEYQPIGSTGGYSEIILNDDAFIVSFEGNSYSSQERVLKFALMRASELTLRNGYKYFEITSSNDLTKENVHTTTKESENTSFYNDSLASAPKNRCPTIGTKFNKTTKHATETVVKPAIQMWIKCYKEKPRHTDAIDAHYYIANNERL